MAPICEILQKLILTFFWMPSRTKESAVSLWPHFRLPGAGIGMMALFHEKIVLGKFQLDRTGHDRLLKRKSVCLTPVMHGPIFVNSWTPLYMSGTLKNRPVQTILRWVTEVVKRSSLANFQAHKSVFTIALLFIYVQRWKTLSGFTQGNFWKGNTCIVFPIKQQHIYVFLSKSFPV